MKLYTMLLLLIFSCDTTGETEHSPINLFNVAGSVSGLNGSLDLQLNEQEILNITSDGNYMFATKIAKDSTYLVEVLNFPSSQSYQISMQSGIISADVTNVNIILADTLVDIDTISGPIKQFYSEDFGTGDSPSWPAPWGIVSETNSPVLLADVVNGRGRLQGSTSNVARIINQALKMENFDATITVEYENFFAQGIGFYGRQNGGRLTATDPTGAGYAVFLEGNGTPQLGLWYELEGDEILAEDQANPLGDQVAFQNGVEYKIRFQVIQHDSLTTLSRSKVWLKSGTEPSEWGVSLLSTYPHLQNVTDGFAFDIYNYSGTSSVYIDDIQIQEL